MAFFLSPLLFGFITATTTLPEPSHPAPAPSLAAIVVAPMGFGVETVVPPLLVEGLQPKPAASQVVGISTTGNRVANGSGAGLGGPIEVWRDRDGLFYLQGLINGRPVRFVIDTGATMIVLTADDARAVGAEHDASASLEADTANGKSTMRSVTLNSIEVAGTGAARVQAAVATSGLKVSLLGQNFLSHISSMTIRGDRMLLQ